MSRTLVFAVAVGMALLGGCASSDVYRSNDYYGGWGDGGYDRRHSSGGRSEPGNESGMVPARPGDARGRSEAGNESGMTPARPGDGHGGGGGAARGGEAGM